MCGIMGIHFRDPRDRGVSNRDLEALVNELLLGIEPRGDDATGLLCVDANGVPQLEKADAAASIFIPWRSSIPKNVRTILGHTRFVTQGKPEDLNNNHPVQYGTCYAIHNGHISNDSDLFKSHSLERLAEVDSEIIPALLSKYGLDNAKDALEELEGGFAIAAVDPEHFPGVTVLAKGYNSPVEYIITKKAVIWASTYEALSGACDAVLGFKPTKANVGLLDEGEILYMEGADVNMAEFTPKPRYKSYSYTSSNYDSQAWGRNNTGYNSKLHDKCENCFCSRLWHGTGDDMSGPCTARIRLDLGGYWNCRCTGFMEVETQTITEESDYGLDSCDGCGRTFPANTLVKHGQRRLCPHYCAPAYERTDEVGVAEFRKAAEAVIAARVEAAKETGDSELDDLPTEIELEMHVEQALLLASERTGMAVAHIDWLLNKASDLIPSDTSGYLSKARSEASDAFNLVWGGISDELAEIDAVRWATGDVYLGPGDDDEECGVVIAIRDEEVVA